MFKFMRVILLVVFIVLQVFSLQAGSEGASAARDFRLTDLAGRSYKLSDYQNKQAVLLFFWTTWCPYCQVELKGLSSRVQELAGEGIEVLAIDVGEPKSRVEKFVQSRNLKLKILIDEDSAVSDAYALLGVPTFYLINRQGRVVFQEHFFPADYKKLIQQ